MRIWSRLTGQIGIKLFFLMAVVLACTIIPLGMVVMLSLQNFTNNASGMNRDQILSQTRFYLENLVSEKGQKLDSHFEKVQTAVALLAVRASELYDLPEHLAPPSALLFLDPVNGMYFSGPDREILDAYWGGAALDYPAARELAVLAALDQSLVQAGKELSGAVGIYIVTVSGIGKYYSLDPKTRKAVRNLPRADVFDLRDSAAMAIFSEREEMDQAVRWTSIYQDDIVQKVMVTAAAPIIDRKGRFLGVIAADVLLAEALDESLLTTGLKRGKTTGLLFSFVVDQQGRIVGFPEDYLAGFGFAKSRRLPPFGEDDLNFFQNSHADFRLLAEEILAKKRVVQQIALNSESYLIGSLELKTLDWRLVQLIREKDILSSVDRIQKAFDDTRKELLSSFLITSIAVSLNALLLVFLALRYFVKPLQSLTRVAKRVGRGDLSLPPSLNREDELGTLSRAMNQMIVGLRHADQMRRDYSLRLERDIQDRTRDLLEKNTQLADLIEDLRQESEKRQAANRKVVEREQQLLRMMESSLAGICIVQDLRFLYVNATFARMTGYGAEEMVGGLGPEDLIMAEYQTMTMERLKQRERGDSIAAMAPYHIQIKTKDGTPLDVLVEGATIFWEGRNATLGSFVNITELKRVEERLRANQQSLRLFLEEKDILLKEVYHRTKNNMLVIIAMLSLQVEEVEDEKAKAIFTEMENRIRAMALVHESLYQSRNLARIDLGEYLENLIRTLLANMSMGKEISLWVKCENLMISFDQAVPVGLVVNELVTNTLKHAFAGSKGGLGLKLRLEKDEIILQLVDDGVGFKEDLATTMETAFGLQITSAIVDRQLRGNLDIASGEGGTVCTVRFPVAS